MEYSAKSIKSPKHISPESTSTSSTHLLLRRRPRDQDTHAQGRRKAIAAATGWDTGDGAGGAGMSATGFRKHSGDDHRGRREQSHRHPQREAGQDRRCLFLGQATLNLLYGNILLKLAYTVITPIIAGHIIQYFSPVRSQQVRTPQAQ